MKYVRELNPKVQRHLLLESPCAAEIDVLRRMLLESIVVVEHGSAAELSGRKARRGVHFRQDVITRNGNRNPCPEKPGAEYFTIAKVIRQCRRS